MQNSNHTLQCHTVFGATGIVKAFTTGRKCPTYVIVFSFCSLQSRSAMCKATIRSAPVQLQQYKVQTGALHPWEGLMNCLCLSTWTTRTQANGLTWYFQRLCCPRHPFVAQIDNKACQKTKYLRFYVVNNIYWIELCVLSIQGCLEYTNVTWYSNALCIIPKRCACQVVWKILENIG